MSNQLQPYRPSAVEQYRTSKALSRLAGETGLVLAGTEARVEVENTILDGIATVGATAMRNVAMVSQLEQQLAQAVPLATSRLQAIGDMTALGMADVVSSAARRIRGRS